MNKENSQNHRDRRGPGAQLREARENKQITQEEAADKLHLSKQQVIAIESDDYQKFSRVTTYIRGYLRMYALLVDISPNEVVKAFDELGIEKNLSSISPLVSAKKQSYLNEENYSRVMRWWTLGITIVVLLLLIIGLRNHFRHKDKNIVEQAAVQTSASASAPVPAPVVNPAPANPSNTTDTSNNNVMVPLSQPSSGIDKPQTELKVPAHKTKKHEKGSSSQGRLQTTTPVDNSRMPQGNDTTQE